MTIGLKTKVVLQYLVPIVLAYVTIAVFWFTERSPSVPEIARYCGGMAIVAVAAALVQDSVPKPFKEWLVFWRIRDRLPGHRAFSARYERADRFNHRNILNWDELASLPPSKQQQIFYQLYRKHMEEKRVEHNSFRYRAWRDSASLAFILSLIPIPMNLIIGNRQLMESAAYFSLGCMGLCLLLIVAARQEGDALISQVLTEEALGRPHRVPI